MSFQKFLPIPIMFGVLAGIATILAGVTGFAAWPIFVGWMVYLFAGAKPSLLSKEGAALIGGVILGYLTFLALPSVDILGATFALPVVVAVAVFVMVVVGRIPLLSLTPAIVVPYATYLAYVLGSFGGAGTTPANSIVPFLVLNAVGFGFGYVSVLLQTKLSSSGSSESSPESSPEGSSGQ